MSPFELLLLSAAAFIGGALNSVAGGGSFFTFPALVFTGSPALVANATSTVALWPGSVASAVGYRHEVLGERELTIKLGVVSGLGGLLGAVGVILTPEARFEASLPWLLLAATLIFTFGDPLRRRLEARGTPPLGVVIALQFVVSVYGGYFGGGMGLMMLALFSLLGPRHLHAMNALKSVLGSAINLTALVIFVAAGKVDWARAAVMTVAAIAGGYLGASWSRRFDPGLVRKLVVVVGWLLTVAFFLR